MKPEIFKAEGMTQIREITYKIFDSFKRIIPQSSDTKIFLKPNFNANMNALTGNTTDLRLIAATIQSLKDLGYNHIVIGEGTNSGYYRNNISVISRLKVDRLAEYYGVKVVDLNYSEPVDVDFEDGVRASVARDAAEADFLINMPKMKTHFEAGMSACLKNLMGCLVGQENKKKTHKSLARNIIHINERLKPRLHIVDGIIAMQGLGPTRGVPVNTGLIIAGTDPFLLDLLCAKIAMFDYKKVTTLKAAETAGFLNQSHHDIVDSMDIAKYQRKFLPPEAGFLASFIHSPKRQKYFLAVRNTLLFNYLCSTELVGKMLFLSGLRQDNFIKDEMEYEGLAVNDKLCRKGCTKCHDYCPVGLKLPDQIGEENSACIECMYCFLVCPTCAIEFRGKLGFMEEQLRQYDKITREVT